MIAQVAQAANSIPVWVYLVGALGVGGIAGGAFAYFGIRHQNSGRVVTSDATDLWTEAGSFRKDLLEEVRTLRLRLTELETKLAEANTKTAELRTEVLDLRRLCGITNDGVAVIQREMAAAKADTPEAQRRRDEVSDAS